MLWVPQRGRVLKEGRVCDPALRILSGGGGVSARPEGTGRGEPGRGGEGRRYKGLKKTGGQVCGARGRHGWATF